MVELLWRKPGEIFLIGIRLGPWSVANGDR